MATFQDNEGKVAILTQAVFLGTRKGLFIARSADRRAWALDEPAFFGQTIYHAVQDPRDPRSVLVATRTGHLGPTVYRSADGGATWQEAGKPPAFPRAAEGKPALSVAHVFWLTPGHASEPGVWYAGASPHGLFRSEDGGATWESVTGFNEHPNYWDWSGDEQASPPGGKMTHSIIVDPRDRHHLYLGLSGGGVFESLDRGASWSPLNQGLLADFLPEKYPEYGQDPHCIRLHPQRPDRLYQQNHCGIYRLDRPDRRWVRIGETMDPAVGDIGFPLEIHARNPDVAWVYPMDGTSVWPRTNPEGRPAVYVTRDAGTSWRRQDRGLPRRAWFTVKRQAMTTDAADPVGVYFGTGSGDLWASANEGDDWACVVSHLPEIYSVEAGVFP